MRKYLRLFAIILCVFIAVDRVMGLVNYGEMAQIFGISSFDEVVENDPFEDRTTQSTSAAVTETTESTWLTVYHT